MKPALTTQKLRGGYYTPEPLAEFLSDWAIQSPDAKILEPSCGDGVFLESAERVLSKHGAKKLSIAHQITGIEYDAGEAKKARLRLKQLDIANPNVEATDFFSFCKEHVSKGQLFDAIIGNPPFIRFQNFLEEHRRVAFELMKTAGLNPNRLTNSWVSFLVASTLLLHEHGRLAMVVPAELFQVNYAAETRQFLSEFFKRITLITFKTLLFNNIQQEVVLFLGERNGIKQEGIRTIELDTAEDLGLLKVDTFSFGDLKPIDHTKEKWTQYFLEKEEILFLRSLKANPMLTLSGEVMDVDVGVVTGENEFFVLNGETVSNNSLDSYVQPIVSRSAHLEGTVFNESDWAKSNGKAYRTFLLTPPDKPLKELPTALRDFILEGETRGANKGYKCRIRKRWYIVPSVWRPDAFMLRQVNGYPKMVMNEKGATCTDTIHRVRFQDSVDGAAVTSAFMNSLTLAFAEVTGRSYGGGVLTFEPSEAENLPLPLIGSDNLSLKYLDGLLRSKGIDAVLNVTDKTLLAQGLGLSADEVKMLREIWQKLRNRRLNRRRKTSVVSKQQSPVIKGSSFES